MQAQQPDAEVSYFKLHGLDGHLAAAVSLAEEGGRQWAVVSIATAEAFPQGALEGVIAHWGMAGTGKTGGWEQPSEGWLSEPDHSRSPGHLLWQTCFSVFIA